MGKISIKQTKDRVKDLLISKPHLKDCDKRLLATIWWKDTMALGYDPLTLNTTQFLHLLAEGKLTRSESVRRSRAKLQEEVPELRGKKYNDRKGLSKAVQTELGYN